MSGTNPVYLVDLVCLVHLVSLMQPNKPDRPNKPNEQDRLADFFSILLKERQSKAETSIMTIANNAGHGMCGCTIADIDWTERTVQLIMGKRCAA
jgi:hypothetical protein